MARKKYRFRPDPTGTDVWNKLYITHQQRKNALKWGLYGGICLAALILQDTILGRTQIFGGYVDLLPCAIALICVVQGAQESCIFALVASMVYVFSGSAPDSFAIAFLTCYSVLCALFREQFLRRSFRSAWLCAGVAVAVYEMSVFLVGLLFGLTYPGRFGVFAMTGVDTVAVMPMLYPLVNHVGKIGGESWKE